jgi:stringent starvation protein B
MTEKYRVISKMLQTGSVFIHVDARVPDVIVPESKRGKPQLILEIGYGMATPIEDLVVNDFGFSGGLLFAGVVHEVFVPWFAVYAAHRPLSAEGKTWGRDMPESVREKLLQERMRRVPDESVVTKLPVAESNVVNLAAWKRGK